ncbi:MULTISPECIES: hypothetical protein [Paraclostridium]|jgi:hypothetical protein|uniref:Uncharacterized protein n=2 Tax=Paraclostridium bifermentans TaxID=1490 RepID=A0AA44IIR9_PARBF|nr:MULTISPECIES: hypothetical protein [Paraclostridium]MCU9810164.1 hypothetical protein [Paraclostridium sp. AKS46]MDU2094438.1 hypothetical protein [Clostridium perfringens]EQK40250.1 hypothetical protein C672_3439 [[Clostridium] bifermentans ATCC 638] [Paraclostridium bifermentans ATCC 638 = DSM 14991]EQK41628.1 hypothetical protein C671_2682 [[Clostridium] bifermentans ATCC 19299] [Paraclostridium bifermentans ATCC 19299]MBN8049364.1 hypothetical protein [Paraclostridium bifermentans]
MPKSLSHYSFNDDLTIRNYLALMTCIINPRMTQSKAVKLFEINCKGDKRRK